MTETSPNDMSRISMFLLSFWYTVVCKKKIGDSCTCHASRWPTKASSSSTDVVTPIKFVFFKTFLLLLT
jgi:hypothetical protein